MTNLQLYRDITVLPPVLQNEVADFVAFLCYKHTITTKPSPKLADFIGSMPNLDIASFENYLTETRNEWNESF
jgi:Protein of unknown function (DUF2281)